VCCSRVLCQGRRYKLKTPSLSQSLLEANRLPRVDSQSDHLKNLRGKRLILDNPVAESRHTKTQGLKKERQRTLRERKSIGVVGRNEAKRKGFWKIEKSAARYHLFLPIHQLWVSYIAELLNLSELPDGHFDPDNLPSASVLQGKLVKADFHGAIITVKECKNVATTGLTGIIVHETENTFKIVTQRDQFKVIPKRNTTFTFRVPLHVPPVPLVELQNPSELTLPSSSTDDKAMSSLDQLPSFEFDLFGNQFCFRSAERATKKFKHKETIGFT